MEHFTATQVVQEEQYIFPYHFADLISDKHKYLKNIPSLDLLRQVKEKVRELKGSYVLDAGCGDGRLIYEMRHENFKIVGVDFSERAIAFARAFTPTAEFHVGDLLKINFLQPFDVIVLMEVVEHFIPEQIPPILEGISKLLKEDGRLIITVPSTNLKLADKHYQHFTAESLTNTIKPFFEVEEMRGYYRKNGSKAVFGLLKGFGSIAYAFRKDQKWAINYLHYLRSFYERKLATGKPEDCYGLFATCKKTTMKSGS
jgi:2-polyprenyl-3-methyl-5-hydroxy-6-metoxy-1,4-benzoquinol methylase